MYFMWVPHRAERPGSGGNPGVPAPKVLDPGADVGVLRAKLRDFDRMELVAAWEISGRRLRSERDPARLLALVRLRGLMLDEVERQSPRRYQRWLRAGGPRRFGERRS
ncbi:MAG: hypothetical protein WB797_12935 [Nocardioides sp.]